MLNEFHIPIHHPHNQPHGNMRPRKRYSTHDAFRYYFARFSLGSCYGDRYALEQVKCSYEIQRDGEHLGYMDDSAEALGWCNAANKCFPTFSYTAIPV